MTKPTDHTGRTGRQPRRVSALWINDWGLTALLVILFVSIFIISPMWNTYYGKILARIFFSLILISGVMTVFESRHLRLFTIAIAAVSMSIAWISYFSPSSYLIYWDLGLGLIFLALLIATILTQVFREGPINIHRICGAVAVYLLAALVWSALYQLLALTLPGAFRLEQPLLADNPDMARATFTYFSFVTITTLGYGDIIPVHPIARMLAILEGLTGQLFPAILLAKLVSLEILHRGPGKHVHRD